MTKINLPQSRQSLLTINTPYIIAASSLLVWWWLVVVLEEVEKILVETFIFLLVCDYISNNFKHMISHIKIYVSILKFQDKCYSSCKKLFRILFP